MLEAMLNLLGRQCYGVLTTTQELFARLRGIELESLIAHKLPCLRKRILATSKFEIIDVDAQEDLHMRVEIKTFPSKDTLKSKVEQRLLVVFLQI